MKQKIPREVWEYIQQTGTRGTCCIEHRQRAKRLLARYEPLQTKDLAIRSRWRVRVSGRRGYGTKSDVWEVHITRLNCQGRLEVEYETEGRARVEARRIAMELGTKVSWDRGGPIEEEPANG